MRLAAAAELMLYISAEGDVAPQWREYFRQATVALDAALVGAWCPERSPWLDEVFVKKVPADLGKELENPPCQFPEYAGEQECMQVAGRRTSEH